MFPFDVIALDADDTLWQNEPLYQAKRDQFIALLSAEFSPEQIVAKLDEPEVQYVRWFGFGIKSFTFSMIETAIALTEGRISGQEIQKIIDFAKDMVNMDVQLLDSVAETIPALAQQYRLMLITKGDLLDQESKLARSGLAEYFQNVEIVSQKNTASYARILQRYAIAPERFLMVGNSLPSDVLPVLDLGGSGVHIPFEITWVQELVETPPLGRPHFYELESLGQLPALLDRLMQSQAG